MMRFVTKNGDFISSVIIFSHRIFTLRINITGNILNRREFNVDRIFTLGPRKRPYAFNRDALSINFKLRAVKILLRLLVR